MRGILQKKNTGWYVLENKTVKNCFGCKSRDVKYYHKLDPEQSQKIIDIGFSEFEGKDVGFKVDGEYVKITTLNELLLGTMVEYNQNQGSYDLENKVQWDDIEEEYHRDEYPPFGGPFTNALSPWEWLKKYYIAPNRKK